MQSVWRTIISLSWLMAGCLDFPVPEGVGGVCESNEQCSTDFCHFGICLTKGGDDDGDGLSNFTEWTIGSNPTLADSDDDNISDPNETRGEGQQFPDRDNDGIPDVLEHNRADMDGDCLPDWADSSQSTVRATQSELRAYHCNRKGLCADYEQEIVVVCEGGVASCIYSAVPGYSGEQENACDGVDENCDGTVDEGFWGSGEAVGAPCTGNGVCGTGVVECLADGTGAVCSSEPFGSLDESGPERCDGQDNDCDGETDEGFTLNGLAVGGPCEASGACGKGPGLVACIPETQQPVCVATSGPVHWIGPEVCDGIDNDCNGSTDDGILTDAQEDIRVSVGDPCGLGACEGGVVVCSTGNMPTCTTAHLSSQEQCDGLDNDCDGTPDNGLSFLGIPLGGSCTGLGTCGQGTVECASQGGVAICSSNPGGTQAQDTPELCDGKDNDCNGFIDDGLGLPSDGFSSCITPGICGEGTFVCSSTGEVVCSTAPGQIDSADSPEQCNGIDDDCDGFTDEATLGSHEEALELLVSEGLSGFGILRATSSDSTVYFAAASNFGETGILASKLNHSETTTLPPRQGATGLPAGLLWSPLRRQLFAMDNGLSGLWGRVHVLDEGAATWAVWNENNPPLTGISCLAMLKSGIVMGGPEGFWFLDFNQREWVGLPPVEGLEPEQTLVCHGGIISDILTIRARNEDSSNQIHYCGLVADDATLDCPKNVPASDMEQGWLDGDMNESILLSSLAGRTLNWDTSETLPVPLKPDFGPTMRSWWEAETGTGYMAGWNKGTLEIHALKRQCPPL